MKIFSSDGATLFKNPTDQTVPTFPSFRFWENVISVEKSLLTSIGSYLSGQWELGLIDSQKKEISI